MKRGGPLRRGGPLARSRSLTRAALPRRAKSMPVTRTAQTAAERHARAVVKFRSGGRCELGRDCAATEWHHRQARSAGGKWTASNGLHLCADHHRHVTVNPTAAREQGWQVPSWADPAETPVFLAGRGLVLLRDDGTTTPAHQVELGETA